MSSLGGYVYIVGQEFVKCPEILSEYYRWVSNDGKRMTSSDGDRHGRGGYPTPE